MQDSDAALKKGDWAAYGEAQKRLNDSLQKAIEAENKQQQDQKQGGDQQGSEQQPSGSSSASQSPSGESTSK